MKKKTKVKSKKQKKEFFINLMLVVHDENFDFHLPLMDEHKHFGSQDDAIKKGLVIREKIEKLMRSKQI
jgi:hypothetical protein